MWIDCMICTIACMVLTTPTDLKVSKLTPICLFSAGFSVSTVTMDCIGFPQFLGRDRFSCGRVDVLDHFSQCQFS